MTRSGDEATCDTSVLVAALLEWHPQHQRARDLIESRVQRIPAHVLLETYSVLTRLPAPGRLTPASANELIERMDVALLTLPGSGHRRLVSRMAAAGIGGGAVHDGLVAATAAHHGLVLISADRRARPTYDVVGARSEFV